MSDIVSTDARQLATFERRAPARGASMALMLAYQDALELLHSFRNCWVSELMEDAEFSVGIIAKMAGTSSP